MILPPWTIKNETGEYRTMVGWSPRRGDALSFDSPSEARAWIEATPALLGHAANEPFDTDRAAVERAGAGLMPAVPMQSHQHDYDPVR